MRSSQAAEFCPQWQIVFTEEYQPPHPYFYQGCGVFVYKLHSPDFHMKNTGFLKLKVPLIIIKTCIYEQGCQLVWNIGDGPFLCVFNYRICNLLIFQVAEDSLHVSHSFILTTILCCRVR